MKRGQISIFIILGVLIIIGGAVTLTVLFSSSSQQAQIISNEAVLASIPSEIQPFYRFVEQCVDETLDSAIRIAGAKGGIIYPSEIGLLFDSSKQTESDGVSLFENSDFGVAYWSYMYGTNDCEYGCNSFVTQIPLTGSVPGSIESQLEMYMDKELSRCVARADRLTEIGVSYEEQGSPVSDVTIGELDVSVEVKYPLFVEKEGVSLVIPTVRGQNAIPLKKYYDDAVLLTEILHEFSAFEEATVQWISIYSGMDSEKLPPMAGSSSDPSVFPYWISGDVKDELQLILERHVPMFSVFNSRNFNPILTQDDTFVQLKDQFYKLFEIPAPEQYNKYNVFFQYAGREPFLRLNNDDQFILPESLHLDFFPWFSITRLRTMYDISYPIVISLQNPDDSYEFAFAYEVNVRNNAPMNDTYTPYDYSQYTNFVRDDTLLCDINQKTSKNVSFTLLNGQTVEPEEGVTMLFHCGDETCALGKTDETGIFNEQLPVCYNGRIDLIKPGFDQLGIRVSPSIEYDTPLGDIRFEPIREKLLKVTDVYTDVRSKQLSGIGTLQEREQVLIQLSRVPADHPFLIQRDFVAVAQVNYSNPLANISLLPGRYEGIVLGTVKTPFYIHPKEKCYDTLFDEVCVDIPQETIIIDTFLTGGARFSEGLGYFEISSSELDGSGIINFKNLFPNIYAIPQEDRIFEDLNAIGSSQELLQRYRSTLEPEFE